jgi:acyl carrier protein
MNTQDRLLDAIRAIVERIAGASRTPEHAGPDTRLADGYWLDSVELLEVIISCETSFGVAFDAAHDFDRGTLATLGTLTELVRAKLPSARVES